MFWRALFAFVAMPGMVAFLVPAFWLWQSGAILQHRWGGVVFVLGTLGLLWCVRDFYVQGKGSLAPWSPPQRLVIVGLYRYSRNPMYVCVTLILLGWAASFASPGLLAYCACVDLAFLLRVVYGEEPWLARQYGASWQAYAERVPRWLGRWRNEA